MEHTIHFKDCYDIRLNFKTGIFPANGQSKQNFPIVHQTPRIHRVPPSCLNIRINNRITRLEGKRDRPDSYTLLEIRLRINCPICSPDYATRAGPRSSFVPL